jgi:hypothetical protein
MVVEKVKLLVEEILCLHGELLQKGTRLALTKELME